MPVTHRPMPERLQSYPELRETWTQQRVLENAILETHNTALAALKSTELKVPEYFEQVVEDAPLALRDDYVREHAVLADRRGVGYHHQNAYETSVAFPVVANKDGHFDSITIIEDNTGSVRDILYVKSDDTGRVMERSLLSFSKGSGQYIPRKEHAGDLVERAARTVAEQEYVSTILQDVLPAVYDAALDLNNMINIVRHTPSKDTTGQRVYVMPNLKPDTATLEKYAAYSGVTQSFDVAAKRMFAELVEAIGVGDGEALEYALPIPNSVPPRFVRGRMINWQSQQVDREVGRLFRRPAVKVDTVYQPAIRIYDVEKTYHDGTVDRQLVPPFSAGTPEAMLSAKLYLGGGGYDSSYGSFAKVIHREGPNLAWQLLDAIRVAHANRVDAPDHQ